MSVNIFKILLLLLLTLAGCSHKEVQSVYEHLTQQERDSLSKMYHDLSMLAYQPSETHRKLKDTALMVDPFNVEYRERLSYSYKKTGEHIRAMELLEEAVEQDVKNGKTFALQYRAWSLLYFYRDYEGTIKDVDQINKMLPTSSFNVCHGEPCDLLKGQALYRLGKYEEAIAVLENLINIEKRLGYDKTGNYLACFYLARCYDETGNQDKAIHYLNERLLVYDKFPEAHFQLGKIYITLGQTEKARYHLIQSREQVAQGYKFDEPYIERFDEVFMYQIEEMLSRLY